MLTGADSATAIKTELESILLQICKHCIVDGRQDIVCNCYLLQKIIQISIGDVEIKLPKIKVGIRSDNDVTLQ